MCLIHSLVIPPNLRYKQLQEFDRTVTKSRFGRSLVINIPHNKAVGSNNAALLSLLLYETKERVYLDILYKRAEIQLPREQIQLHDEAAG
jgi:hypothetical protein